MLGQGSRLLASLAVPAFLYLPAPRAYCPPGPSTQQTVRAAGGLCIADEVQTGFGRTGSAYWGFQNQVRAAGEGCCRVGQACPGHAVVSGGQGPCRASKGGRNAGALYAAAVSCLPAPPITPTPALGPCAGRGAGHRHDGKGDRQRPAPGCGCHHPRDSGDARDAPPLQHLWCVC